MNIDLLHPRDQIVMIMKRIYGYGMTTTSGGNISVLDENGDIWISPGGVDKGSLRPEDIVRIRPDGSYEGIHKPSIELPFHRAIYRSRPDLGAVIHAHPVALVSFSVARKIPDTSIVPKARKICGEVGYAPYALPGSERLGDNIAAVFGEGYNTALLENHGVACSGGDLFEAFMRFETLDYCARLIIRAGQMGGRNPAACPLNDEELSMSKGDRHLVEEFVPKGYSSREREARKMMLSMVHRAYDQRLCTSTEGTFSLRVEGGDFLITPYGIDRKYMEISDLVSIREGKREKGKEPSRSLILHQKIYARHPDINAVIIAHPTSIMAFAVSRRKFDTLVIPETYVMLMDIPLLPYGTQYREQDRVAELISPENPVVLVENDCIITSGGSLLEAFDRLEVAEFSAGAVVSAGAVGGVVPISPRERVELEAAFLKKGGKSG
jgi:L-fuculose-phosphate aldolase